MLRSRNDPTEINLNALMFGAQNTIDRFYKSENPGELQQVRNAFSVIFRNLDDLPPIRRFAMAHWCKIRCKKFPELETHFLDKRESAFDAGGEVQKPAPAHISHAHANVSNALGARWKTSAAALLFLSAVPSILQATGIQKTEQTPSPLSITRASMELCLKRGSVGAGLNRVKCSHNNGIDGQESVYNFTTRKGASSLLVIIDVSQNAPSSEAVRLVWDTSANKQTQETYISFNAAGDLLKADKTTFDTTKASDPRKPLTALEIDANRPAIDAALAETQKLRAKENAL